ncbi:unnamed protein product [Closterium sp. Yama58-4]|nr:unnamed protein product [Closterium sp. Yama58-4]
MASVVLPPCPRHSRHGALLAAPPASPLRVSFTSSPPRHRARLSLCCLRCTATRRPHAHEEWSGTNAAVAGPLRAAAHGCGGEHKGWMARPAAAESDRHTRGGPWGSTRRLALAAGYSARRASGFPLHSAHRLRARCRLQVAVRAFSPRAPLTSRLRRTALGWPPPQWRRCAPGITAAALRADLLAQAWRTQGSAQTQAVGADGAIRNGQGIGFWRADDAGASGWRGGGDEARDEQRAGWQAEGQAGAAESGESEAEKEKRRRGRISEANKGKVPWNKGRQWSAEVRAKIRERTKQAMSNPEVRERLRDHGHTQSAETRSLIRERMRAAWQRKKQERLAAQALLAEWQGELAAAAQVGLAGDRVLVRCGNGRVVYADESEEHRRRISEAIKAKWADPAYRSNVARGMKSVQRAHSPAHPTSPAPAPAAAPRAARARRAVRGGERERRETTKDTAVAAAAAGGQGAEGGGEGGEGAAGRSAEEAVVAQADEAFVQAVMAAESAQAQGAQGGQGAAQQSAEQAQGDGGVVRFKRVLIVRQTGGSAGEEEARGANGEERVEESTEVAVRVGVLGEGGLQGGEEAKGHEEREEKEEGEGGEEEEVESDVEDIKTLVEASAQSGWRFSAGDRRQVKEGSESDGGAGQGSVSGAMHGVGETGNGAAVRHHHVPSSAAPVPSLLPLAPTTNQRRLARQLIARRRRQLAERARVLMQEAQSAAQSLEALAARDATAMASLLETRRLLEQAGRAVARAERTPTLPLRPKGTQEGGAAHGVPGGDWRSGASGSGSAAWTQAGAMPGRGGDGGQAGGQVRGAESEAEQAGAGNGAVRSAYPDAVSERVLGSMGGVVGSEWQRGQAGSSSSAAQGKWVESGGEDERRGAGGSVEWVAVNGARISAGAAQGSGQEGRVELQGAESSAGVREAVVETPPGGEAGRLNGRAGRGDSAGEQGGEAGKR